MGSPGSSTFLTPVLRAPDLIKGRHMEGSRVSIPRADTLEGGNMPFGPRHLLGGWSYLLAGQVINS